MFYYQVSSLHICIKSNVYVFCHNLEVPPLHPVEVVIRWVAELGRVARHAVHQGRELYEGVDQHGREAEQEGEV